MIYERITLNKLKLKLAYKICTHWAKKCNDWVNIMTSDSLHLRNLEVGIEGLFSVTDSQKIPHFYVIQVRKYPVISSQNIWEYLRNYLAYYLPNNHVTA